MRTSWHPYQRGRVLAAHVRFGRDQAESTTRTYAGAVALCLTWCGCTGRNWTAAGRLGSFMFWLRHSPGDGTPVVAGPGSEPVRGPRRISTALAGVHEFLAHATTLGTVPTFVLSQLYEVADDRDLPVQAHGEDSGLRYYAKARYRAAEPGESVGRASDEDVLALLRACRSARRCGLKWFRGGVVGCWPGVDRRYPLVCPAFPQVRFRLGPGGRSISGGRAGSGRFGRARRAGTWTR
ncbi:hypothetical protein [Streptomyces sp. NPDC056304]|uniref:hypothetical protein n=1 Tax=Streptomyces sp. NPDC056304 TaxID=3345778 RepID=UPI0035D5832F